MAGTNVLATRAALEGWYVVAGVLLTVALLNWIVLWRLEIITERFSNIGSVPTLRDENILQVTQNAINYLQNRISRKVTFTVESAFSPDITAKVNVSLYDWVIENICKNAVDAMEGRGSIKLQLSLLGKSQIALDISDTGKGIPKSKMDSVFLPGFTTKKRGWGLGLGALWSQRLARLPARWSSVRYLRSAMH